MNISKNTFLEKYVSLKYLIKIQYNIIITRIASNSMILNTFSNLENYLRYVFEFFYMK